MKVTEIYDKISTQLKKKSEYSLRIVDEDAILLSEKNETVGMLSYNPFKNQLLYAPLNISYTDNEDLISKIRKTRLDMQDYKDGKFIQPDLFNVEKLNSNYNEFNSYKNEKNLLTNNLEFIVKDNFVSKYQLAFRF